MYVYRMTKIYISFMAYTFPVILCLYIFIYSFHVLHKVDHFIMHAARNWMVKNRHADLYMELYDS